VPGAGRLTAAAATLHNRAANQEAESIEEADEIGRWTVLDPTDDEAAEGMDVVSTGDAEDEGEDQKGRRQLLEMMTESRRAPGSSTCIIHDAR
jgi:hypothetical protein